MISVTLTGLDTVMENLVSYEVDQINRLRLACIEIAHVLEQYAITHHPWQVQTQATNLTTKGTFEEVADDLFEVVLSAGMDYDRFLELAGPYPGAYAQHLAALPNNAASDFSQGKYAWLWPTMVENLDEIRSIFARHLSH